MAPRKTKLAAGTTSAGKKQAQSKKPTAVAKARVEKKPAPKKVARPTQATRAPSARVAAMRANQLAAAQAESQRRAVLEAELYTLKTKRQAATASGASARQTTKTASTAKTAAGKRNKNEPATKARTSRAKTAPKATQTGRITKSQSAATKKKAAPKSQLKTTAAKAKAAPKTAAKAPAKAAPAAKKTTTAAKKTEAKPAANISRKRKAADDDEEDTAPATKKAKTAAPKKAAAPKKERKIATPRAKAAPKPTVVKKLPVINEAPTQVIIPFCVGSGDSGELGLGTGKGSINLPRAKPHPFFAAGKVEIVQYACGGMHGLVLSKDGKVYSWGVNDDGALGRDTSKAEVKTRDMDAPEEESDDEEVEDNGLNPLEANPYEIDMTNFPEGVKITQVAAGDSISVFLLEDGRVFACGSFRDNNGPMGFNLDLLKKGEKTSRVPVEVPELRNIKKVYSGDNFCLALDKTGTVFAWGSGQNSELGRKLVERTAANGLVPSTFGLKKTKKQYTVDLFCGSNHAFALDNNGDIWAWGSDNMGQCAARGAEVGDANATLDVPTKVEALSGEALGSKIVKIDGGNMHSIGITEDGKCYAWGRCDGAQSGIDLTTVPKEKLRDNERGQPAILIEPTVVPGLTDIVDVASGPGHCFAVAKDGKGYSWGLNNNWQLGQGKELEDEPLPLVLRGSTITDDVKFVSVGCGGSFNFLGTYL